MANLTKLPRDWCSQDMLAGIHATLVNVWTGSGTLLAEVKAGWEGLDVALSSEVCYSSYHPTLASLCEEGGLQAGQDIWPVTSMLDHV